MRAIEFNALLVKFGACNEAVQWAEGKTLEEAWNTCDRADWMLWLVAKIDVTYSPRLRLAACACARTALKYVPEGEDRLRLTIECAERFARGEATQEELSVARTAAGASRTAWAAGVAAWAAEGASWAAGVAAGAAAGTSRATWAAEGASRAAWAAWTAGVAAGAAAGKEMSDLIRGIITPDDLFGVFGSKVTG